MARRPGLLPALGVRTQLGILVALSWIARSLASVGHAAPRYFPDEYIYATLGRSIGLHGSLTVRGAAAHFPALLEPLVASPLWALASLGTAYHLVQFENALAMSLAAIPVYLLARKVELQSRYALLCAAFAVAIPDLLFSSYILADPIAYPLVLASLYAGLTTLERPRLRADLTFAALAGLAVLARVEYVALFAGFAIAALVLERRRVIRTHPLVAAAFAGGLVVSLAMPHRLLGYYSGVLHLHVGLDTARWALTDVFLLALSSGVVMVPGAALGLFRPRTSVTRAFTALTLCVGGVILLEAALYASNGSGRFQERYLFSLLPLVPIASGLRAGVQGRMRVVPVVVGAALVVALARVPLAGYASGTRFMDSPFLSAVAQLENRAGIGGGAEAVALAGTLAALFGVVLALRGYRRVAVGIAIAIVTLYSVAATKHDLALGRDLTVPYRSSWIDERNLGRVAAIQTDSAPPAPLLSQLFWNPSVSSEYVLQDAVPTDTFATAKLMIGRDGALRTASGPLRSPFLFQGFGVAATFAGADLVGREGTFDLWRPVRVPRLRILATGHYWDGWLAWQGRVTVWPTSFGASRGTLALTLSLPRGLQPVRIRFGSRTLRVVAGRRVHLRWQIVGTQPWTISFAALDKNVTRDLRAISVRSTMPVFTPTMDGSRARLKTVHSPADR